MLVPERVGMSRPVSHDPMDPLSLLEGHGTIGRVREGCYPRSKSAASGIFPIFPFNTTSTPPDHLFHPNPFQVSFFTFRKGYLPPTILKRGHWGPTLPL